MKGNIAIGGLIAAICTGVISTKASAQEPSVRSDVIARPLVATWQSPAVGETNLEREFRLIKAQLGELETELAGLQDSQPSPSDQVISNEQSNELEALKEQIDAQSEALEKINDKLPGLATSGHSAATMKISGRIHSDYWAFPAADASLFPLEGGLDPDDRFIFRRLRFGVGGDISDNIGYRIEMEFADPSSLQYRDAYINVDHLPYLNTLIVGNHKRPYGLDHINSSRYNVFLERPYVIEAFNQDSRRLGVSSNGYTSDERFNWRFGIWNQELSQGLGGYIGDHYQLEGAGRLAATPWYDEASGGRGYLHLAIAGSLGYPDGLDPVNNQARYRTRAENRSSFRWLDTGRIDGADTNLLGGLEAALNLGRWQFVGEMQRVNVDRLAGFGPDVQFHGGYFYVSYFLTGEHMPWDRKTGQLGRIEPFENFFRVRTCDGCIERGRGAWQVAVRYSYADLSDLDIVGGVGRSWTYGLNWYWNP